MAPGWKARVSFRGRLGRGMWVLHKDMGTWSCIYFSRQTTGHHP